MLSPKTPRARSAMSSPTVRVIASATAFSGAPACVLVRCSKLESNSLSGTLRMRSSRNKLPERLSIISRAVIWTLPEKRHVYGTGQSGKRRGMQRSKKKCGREVLIECRDPNLEENRCDLRLFFGHGSDQRLEDLESVSAAKIGFAGAFRVRHHPEYVSACVTDAGDIVERPVGIGI